jgi:tight adherence protein B
MYSTLGLLLVLAFGLLALQLSRASRMRRLAMGRIAVQVQELEGAAEMLGPDVLVVRRFPTRYRWAGPVVGVLVAGLVLALTTLPKLYAVGVSVLVASLLHLFENSRADRQVEQMEAQLADAIDMLVSSLRAGSALLAALDAALREARMPLRAELEDVVGRIRIGDDPRAVVQELAQRVPLESFRLFAHTLLVHWETGGSLTSALRTVSKTVRDRLEISRRISAQAIESQVSVAAVMLITYGLLIFELRSNPGPMQNLLYSVIGSSIGTALMVLQSAGMLWIWHMSRIRF